jgi:hypothetical protein
VRLAVVTLDKRGISESFTPPLGEGVEVGLLQAGVYDDQTKLLLYAAVPLAYPPKVTSDNMVVVDELAGGDCEPAFARARTHATWTDRPG